MTFRLLNATKLFVSLVIILTCMLSFNANATHMSGTDLTYTHVSGNTYKFTLKFYRDCSGSQAPQTANILMNAPSCGISQTFTLTRIAGTGQEISTACATAATTCQGGSEPGFQEYVFEGTTTLAQCSDWTFTYKFCCRSNSITTVVGNPDNYGVQVNATLNNLIGQNSSPAFSNIPVSFICTNQSFSYNHGAIDAEGDSLVYTLVNPLDSSGVNVPYTAPYSYNNPITSSPALTLDSVTGDFNVFPTVANEISILAIRVQEYRNGFLIGSVVRDMLVYTVTCNNQLPVASGIDGTNSFTKSLCVGGQFCFNINSTDADVQQVVTMTWNNGIPAGTFTTTTAGRPVGTFCWAPTVADARSQPYTFTVTVRDNACPQNGLQTFSYAIYVSALSVGITGRLETICHDGHDGTATANATSGIGPFTYSWSPGEQTTKTISRLVPGVYTVTITDSVGCTGSQSVTITEPAAVVPNLTHTDVDCQGNLGSATANASGGYGPYTYIWNGDSTLTGNSLSNLTQGFYKVYVRDSRQCPGLDSVYVQGSTAITATSSVTNASCAAASNGSVSVTASGGSGAFTYIWNPNVSSSANANNLAPGVYSCEVSDGACSFTVTATVADNNFSPVVNLGPDLTPCAGDFVLLNAGSGFATYLWNDSINSTTQTITVDDNGVYAVAVTDANGCTGGDAVAVTYQGCSRIFHSDDVAIGVYPNPGNGEFTLTMNGYTGNVKLEIFNTLSQVIFSKNYQNQGTMQKTIATHLSKGAYIMKVSFGQETKLIKYIVQ